MYLLDRPTSNPAIDQGGTILGFLWQDDTFAVWTVIFSSDVVWCIDRSQETRKLKVGMHGEKLPSKILWTLAELQKSGHELFRRRSRPSLTFSIFLFHVFVIG